MSTKNPINFTVSNDSINELRAVRDSLLAQAKPNKRKLADVEAQLFYARRVYHVLRTK